MIFVRSLLFNVFEFITVMIAATLLLVTFWAPPRFRHGVCRAWCSLMVWAVDFFCGIKTVVEGAENVPDTPSVVLIKHTSTLETLWQVSFFPQTVWVVKREILFAPVFGWAIGLALDPIAIDRKASGSAVKQVIRQGRDKLRQGIWVTVFPEGTRMAPGKTRTYGTSGAALARDANVPIVPVAHNAGDFWGRRSFNKRPGTVRFVIGPPIDAANRPAKETNLIVQDWIESTMREISVYYQQHNNSQ
ncbi:MAG TPA: lysophospholipid acyltransferase family protein [Woeseiaceae bacterium]|nr:lysophospholipid acyltransferase family protein [Woeseiaceae bacterium]